MTTDTPSVLALCVSAEVRALNAIRRMTGQKLAAEIGRSQNYVAERLRDEKSFTLDDVDAICTFYELDPGEFVEKAFEVHAERVTKTLGADNVVQLGARKRDEGPAVPEDVAAHTEPGPSMYEQVTGAQDAAAEAGAVDTANDDDEGR